MLIAWNHMLRCTYFLSFFFFFPSLSQVFLTFQAPMVYKQIPKSILTYNPVIRNQVNNNSWCFTDFLLKIEGAWVGQIPISLHHLQGYLNSTYTTQPIPLPTQLCRDAFSLWWDSVHQKLSKRFEKSTVDTLLLGSTTCATVQGYESKQNAHLPPQFHGSHAATHEPNPCPSAGHNMSTNGKTFDHYWLCASGSRFLHPFNYQICLQCTLISMVPRALCIWHKQA